MSSKSGCIVQVQVQDARHAEDLELPPARSGATTSMHDGRQVVEFGVRPNLKETVSDLLTGAGVWYQFR